LLAKTDTLGNQRIILVVEDDESLRSMWRIALRFEGFDVVEAGDGIEALRVIDQRIPDLVVLDLGLPKLGGESVRQEIGAQALTRQIPVVIVTGSTEDLGHLEVPCILRKPVAIEDLIRTVRSCIYSGAAGLHA
jgi:two-component system KDP operon response regulator KdpE